MYNICHGILDRYSNIHGDAKGPSYEFTKTHITSQRVKLTIMKTNRLRYAGHMIGRPEDLPQKAIVIARPHTYTYTGRKNIEKMTIPDWTNRAQDREQWKELLRQALTANWL
jgi:hypothetical protein